MFSSSIAKHLIMSSKCIFKGENGLLCIAAKDSKIGLLTLMILTVQAVPPGLVVTTVANGLLMGWLDEDREEVSAEEVVRPSSTETTENCMACGRASRKAVNQMAKINLTARDNLDMVCCLYSCI